MDVLSIISIVLFFVAFALSGFNMYTIFSRKKEKDKEKGLESVILNEKILLLRKEIRVLEKRIAIQDEQTAQLTSSLVSFEKVLTTLLSTYTNGFGGGGGGFGDGNIH